jgi:hypothetical protein
VLLSFLKWVGMLVNINACESVFKEWLGGLLGCVFVLNVLVDLGSWCVY